MTVVGKNCVEVCPVFLMKVINEIIERRAADIPPPDSPESGEDLKVRINAYIDEAGGEMVSEIDIRASMGMPLTQASLRVVRDVLRELDMEYHGLDLWRDGA